jgi:hypothetical protein
MCLHVEPVHVWDPQIVITKMSCGNAPNSNIPPRRKLSPLHGRTLIYRRKGNRGAVLLLLGYEKIESSARCLGIDVDDALAIAEQVDVLNTWAARACSVHRSSAALGQQATTEVLLILRACTDRACPL